MRTIDPDNLGAAPGLAMASRVRPPRVLVWQWGRRGAGPRFAAQLAAALGRVGIDTVLSLSTRAEILATADAPHCGLPVETYGGLGGLLRRAVTAPFLAADLWRRLRQNRPDFAVCAMAGPLDLLMAAVLAIAGIPYAIVMHEAVAHPGDRWRVQYRLQRQLARRAHVVVALSRFVATQLRDAGITGHARMVVAQHPPFTWSPQPAPRAHGGRLRVLLFGRLLRYKGLDLLADALTLVGRRDDLAVRVVGHGPEGPALTRLRALPDVEVENRWVAESELADLLGWSDVVVMSHRAASQSGVAAAAVGAGRWIIATRVGGLPEQLADAPMTLLCEPEAPALAVAIEAMLATGRPRTGAVSRVQAEQQWDDLAHRITWALEAARLERPSVVPAFARHRGVASKP